MTDVETIELACRRAAAVTGSPDLMNLADQIAKILRERRANARPSAAEHAIQKI